MVLNIVLDTAVGAIPFIGPVFDLFYKANLRNVLLLMEEISKARRQ
jgi:hypothetical protein